MEIEDHEIEAEYERNGNAHCVHCRLPIDLIIAGGVREWRHRQQFHVPTVKGH